MTQTLNIAVSARALFDLEAEDRLFREEGLETYVRHQREHKDVPLPKGAAFHLVKGLVGLNGWTQDVRVSVIVLSSMNPACGLRLINSAKYHGLEITRSAFTGGRDTAQLLSAFGADLFLSRNEEDVAKASAGGITSAYMSAVPEGFDSGSDEIHIAFDGDAVIFSGESERIFKEEGLEAFRRNESEKAKEPLKDGPFAKLLRLLHGVQTASGAARKPFRISLVTARGEDTQERVLNTFEHWGVEIDEAYFLCGAKKRSILEAIRPHIFFDDQDTHVVPASEVVPSGRVGSPAVLA